MLTDSLELGQIRNEPYDFFVSRAIREAAGMPLFALSLDPDGLVWAEPVEEAFEDDLIGVFEPNPRLSADMRDALRHEAIHRGFRNPPPPRRGPKARSATF